MLGPLNVKLEEFAVSPSNAFLPDQLPLTQLPDPYYAPWEAVLSHLPTLLCSASLRNHIDQLDVLSTSRLSGEREWQRAYLILSFFTHGYIWEAGGPSERLPAQIAVPFMKVAAHLDLPPTATYAALNLWNYTAIDPTQPLHDVENLRSLHTFTGTKDEEWFYLISVAIESQGARIVPVMLCAMDAVRANNSAVVIESLEKFGTCLKNVGEILKRMYEHCDPMVFYNDIRPFLAGSKNMGVAGLPSGVFYEEGAPGGEKGEWRAYSGGSNAQSSLIQFFDVVLGVEHSLTGGAKGSKNGFLQEMRNYMPGPHRNFLNHIESLSNIRSFVSNSPIPEVATAYNNAVAELASFRDIHIQIITRYIITPSKQYSPTGNPGLNLAVASAKSNGGAPTKGTGGTDLLPFLKQSRDETRDTRVD